MKKLVLQRSVHLILLLFLFISCHQKLLANGHPTTPTCPIVTERFQGLANGTTSNNASTGWYLDASHVLSTGYFAVKSNRFHAQELGGEGIWYSKVFSVAGYSDFQVAVKVSSEGDMNSSEYVKVYYKINGGAETLLDSRTGNFGTLDFISPTLTGNNVQLVVKIYNYNNGGSQTSKYYIEEYRVFKEHGPCGVSLPVSVSASNNGIITCTNSSLTLSASTTVTGTTTWSWTGPGGFTSTSQNPSISTAGTYTVTGTNGTLTGTASMSITQNKTAPVVTATGGALGCAASVTINASSSASNSTFSWSGPGGFTSSLQNPVVTAGGTYTVTVTDPSNGCSASKSVTVVAGSVTTTNLWAGDFTLANGSTSDVAPSAWTSTTPNGVFSVQNNEFRVNNTSVNGEGVWTSEVLNIAGKSNISISAGVRSGVSSGGALENSGSSLDYVRMYYILNGGAEVLFNEQLGTINSNSATNTPVSVGSLAGSTLQVVIRARATATDEFYYFDDVKITSTQSNINAVAGGGGTLTCATTSVGLTGSSTTAGATYSWTGPNGYTSTQQNPSVTAPGNYILTVTAGGCSNTSAITVAQNINPPANLAISSSTNDNQINCLVGGMTLTASSSTPGVTYSWSTPNGSVPSGGATTAVTPGNYIVTATNPATGCSVKDTFVVVTNYATPVNGQINPNPGVLTCIDSTVTLTGTNSLAGVTFTWATNTGVFIANGPVLTVSQPGFYNLIMKHPVSGCNHTIGVSVISTKTPPADLAIAFSSANTQINCISNSVALTGSSSTPGATFSWRGPNGFIASGSNAIVSDEGEYILTSTNPASGCTASVSKVIVSNKTVPSNVAATAITNGGQLTCTFTSINLSASSSTSGVNYSWSGTGFTANGATVSVSAAGTYTVTATDPVNGCSANAIATITQNNTLPAGVSATHTDILTCLTTSIDLTGNSSTPGATFLWTGPGGFNVAARNTEASLPGTYFLKVTNPTNGCFRTVSTTVEQDITAPADVLASNNGPLTCTNNQVTLTGSTSAMDVDYLWTGPGGNFISFVPTVTVTAPGTYSLTVTDLSTNGCATTVTTTVTQDLTGCSGNKAPVTPDHIPSLNSADESVTAFSHKVYPNPFSDHVSVEFRSPGSDYVSVGIFNSIGVQEKTIFNSKVVAGRMYKLVLDADTQNLSSGIHYCIIEVNGKLYSHKLVLIR